MPKEIFILDDYRLFYSIISRFKARSRAIENSERKQKMIVDCHTHIDVNAGDAAAAEHLAAVDTVDYCFVLAQHNDLSNEENNRLLAEYVEKHSEKMTGFAVITPTDEKSSTDDITHIREKLGLKGIVIYCPIIGMHPANSSAMPFYESTQELGMPVFFHNSGTSLQQGAYLEYAQPFLIDEVARQFPSLKIIIGNMGVPFLEQTLLILTKHKNVYADLTIKPKNLWHTYNTVVAAYEYGVMDKLLFGSGFPTGDAGQCIETLLGFNMILADTNLPTVPRNNIRSIIERNTLKLLGLENKTQEQQQ